MLNFEEVPNNILTGKDLDYLSDIFNWNYVALKKTNADYKLVNDEEIISAFDLKTGEELTYGNRGELRVLSPCVMLGYYKNPEATAQFF